MDESSTKNKQRKEIVDSWLKGYTSGSDPSIVRGDVWSTDHVLMSAAQAGFDACRKEQSLAFKQAFTYAESVIPD